MRKLVLVVAVIVVLGCAGCGGVADTGSENPSENSRVPRQVDDEGRRLPFETSFHDRWNRRNDGTTYEPCTALDSPALRRIEIDPSSAADAAGTDGQTARGCRWKFEESAGQKGWTIRQFVGNSRSLNDFRVRSQSTSDRWLPSEFVAGREVGMHTFTHGRQCDTYVQSSEAGVVTMVHASPPIPKPSEICSRTLEFTRATIGKMPL